jgi:hypothetical protein
MREISVMGGHGGTCAPLISSELATLAKPMYSFGVSVMPIPHSIMGHLAEHRTFRKRVLRAERLGYYVRPIDIAAEHDDIMAINTSAPERQGRPMDDSYVNKQRPSSGLPSYTCPWHEVVAYGVCRGDTVYGYAVMYRCGELLHVSQFLGHAEFLDDGIMFKLVKDILSAHEGRPGVLFYNRHDSGTDGLRWFKERIGLKAEDVKWTL